ncbi:hypothetical protein DRN97_02230 [Methanosarcinales archaeon]|nr:MAG: hypothetical protein DRN97_02230 [Methanosarcinales archaeon]
MEKFGIVTSIGASKNYFAVKFQLQLFIGVRSMMAFSLISSGQLHVVMIFAMPSYGILMLPNASVHQTKCFAQVRVKKNGGPEVRTPRPKMILRCNFYVIIERSCWQAPPNPGRGAIRGL